MLENKTHGEIVQEMNRLLEARVEQFESAAAEVREWDRMLIRNAAQVGGLVDNTKLRQRLISHEFRSITFTPGYPKRKPTKAKFLEVSIPSSDIKHLSARTWRSLKNTLNSKSMQLPRVEVLAGRSSRRMSRGHRREFHDSPMWDFEHQAEHRGTPYSAETAKSLFRQLENVDKDLSSMIDEVNRLSVSTSLPTNGEDHSLGANKDPVHQITAILNTHVTSLEWINNQTAKLKEEVGSLEAAHEKATGVELGRSMSQSMSASRSGALGTSTSSLGRSGLRRSGFVNSPRQR